MSKYKPWKYFEGEVARELKDLGFDAKRNWNTQFERKSGVDVIASRNDIKLLIQCKYGKKPNLRRAYLEAVLERGKKWNETPVAICRFSEDRDTLVVLCWRDFKKLLE